MAAAGVGAVDFKSNLADALAILTQLGVNRVPPLGAVDVLRAGVPGALQGTVAWNSMKQRDRLYSDALLSRLLVSLCSA